MKRQIGAKHRSSGNDWRQKTMSNDSHGETQWTMVCRTKIIKNIEYHYTCRSVLICHHAIHVAGMIGSETEIDKSEIDPNVINAKFEDVKKEMLRTGRKGQTQIMKMPQCSHSVKFVTFHI